MSESNSNEKTEKPKARTFDLETIFAQTLAQAPTYQHGASDPTIVDLKTREVDDEEEEDVGPALPAGFVPDESVKVAETITREDSDDDDAPVTVSQLIPAACEATIKLTQKTPISAISFDLQGSKFALGNFSYFVHLFEFLKMDSAMKPFRELMPSESHVIHDLAYSANGERLLIASGESVVKILDRKGQQICETVRGDQYLVDVGLTKGHTAAVNACCWNPLQKNEFLTCSEDGTLRIWSMDDYKEITNCINTQRSVIRTRNAAGKRVSPRVCCYSRDGRWIATGCEDGAIQVWKNGKNFVRPQYWNKSAHKGAITGMEFSPNGKELLTRGLDHSLKLFAFASFKSPKLEANDVPNCFNRTDCGYSPHGEFVFTATSQQLQREQYAGALCFFSSETLDLLYKIEYPNAACVRVCWHSKINQILAALSDGTAKNYYDPKSSVRGALLCAQKPIRRPRAAEIVREDLILSPLALEMFQPRGEEGEEKEVTEWRIKKFLKMQSNFQRPEFRKPAEMPMTSNHSAGGRLAQSGGSLHSYIAQQLGTEKNRGFIHDQDIRQSILRHAEECADDPIYISKAYEKTQPVPIFQDKTTNSDEEREDGDEDDEPVFKAAKLG
ncbi:hypothetical protein M3Y95_01127700 [Aphelenchoides besseyi]|nr:hypothetical protein M3Y95_01127700 [Aphelenchoides besseyi]